MTETSDPLVPVLVFELLFVDLISKLSFAFTFVDFFVRNLPNLKTLFKPEAPTIDFFRWTCKEKTV